MSEMKRKCVKVLFCVGNEKGQSSDKLGIPKLIKINFFSTHNKEKKAENGTNQI